MAADVCRALELEDVNKAISRLDDDEGTRIGIPHPQNHEKRMMVNAVNEPGLYSLVLGSRKLDGKQDFLREYLTTDVKYRMLCLYSTSNIKRFAKEAVSMNGFAYIRNALRMSGASIARKLGVTRSAVSLWEHNKSKISSDKLKQLSEMLSIPQEYFGEITEEQEREIDLIIQCNIAEAQREFELSEADNTMQDFKGSLLRIRPCLKNQGNCAKSVRWR